MLLDIVKGFLPVETSPSNAEWDVHFDQVTGMNTRGCVVWAQTVFEDIGPSVFGI